MRHVVSNISAAAMYGCWAFIGALWIAGARRSAELQAAGREGRDTLSALASVLAVAAVLSPASVWRQVFSEAPLPRALGVLLLVAATGYTAWARAALGRMWSSAAVAREHHRLVTSGPYSITRHPIYTGIIAMLAATALAQGFGRWIAIAPAVSLLLAAKARREERLLGAVFGREYSEYATRVPALLPRPRVGAHGAR